MWQCMKCQERVEDTFEVCWNCGTSKDGAEDPNFRKADDMTVAEIDAQTDERPGRGERLGRGPSGEGGRMAKGQPEYEFTPQQNEAIGGLASAMRFVGICLMIWGVLQILTLFAGNVLALISGVICLLTGIWTNSAASSFRSMVDTKGRDIANLMQAVGSLRSLYNLQRVLIIIALILIPIGIIGGLVAQRQMAKELSKILGDVERQLPSK